MEKENEKSTRPRALFSLLFHLHLQRFYYYYLLLLLLLFFGVSFLLFNFRLMLKHRTKSRENIEKNKNRVANVYNYLSLMALCVVCASVSVCVALYVALYVGHLVLPRADTFLARTRVASTSFRRKSNDLYPPPLSLPSLVFSLSLSLSIPLSLSLCLRSSLNCVGQN